MPPVPVHIDDPITPTKPQGVTPQTAEQPEASPAENVATTAQLQPAAYPPARPGAAAVPAPTPYIPRPPPQPSRTTQPAQNGPPPPQPGAVPMALGQQVPMSATSTLPPPPKPGEASQQQQQQATMPNQMSIPPPQQNYAPTHSTSYLPPSATSTQQQSSGPTTLNLGPVSAPHDPQAQRPPGYLQNVHAQEMSSAQRSSLEEQERKESVLANIGGDAASETAGNMWNTVKGWASAAGGKLAETHENVWKKVDGH